VIGIDTNILVRFLTADDKQQYDLAVDLISKNQEIFVSITVMMELEWVLRSAYKVKKDEIAKAFKGLLELEHLVFENELQLSQAITYYEGGLDFADAIHTLSAKSCDRFFTFDKKFVLNSTGLTQVSVIELK